MQRLEIRVQSDDGEEIEEQEIPGRQVEPKLDIGEYVQRGGGQADKKAARHRLWNVELAQQRNFTREPLAQRKHKGGQVEDGKALELHGLWGITHVSYPGWSAPSARLLRRYPVTARGLYHLLEQTPLRSGGGRFLNLSSARMLVAGMAPSPNPRLKPDSTPDANFFR